MAESDDDSLTPRDMRQWLQQEVLGVMKAAELRVKDATDFVTAYAVGEITPEQAMERLDRYQSRWQEPIPGVAVAEGMSDEKILRARDREAGLTKTWAEDRPGQERQDKDRKR
jgi:hypothetical protein